MAPAPDRETLRREIARVLVPGVDHWLAAGLIADALLAGPLAPPAAAPGPDGEAVERVRAWLDAMRACGPAPDWVAHTMFGADLALTDVAALLAAVDRRLTADAQGEVEFGVEWSSGSVSEGFSDYADAARYVTSGKTGFEGRVTAVRVMERTVREPGPWRPAPSPGSGEARSNDE